MVVGSARGGGLWVYSIVRCCRAGWRGEGGLLNSGVDHSFAFDSEPLQCPENWRQVVDSWWQSWQRTVGVMWEWLRANVAGLVYTPRRQVMLLPSC